MSERIEARLTVSGDHPCLPGHFPGQPVVPGVLLLERLIEAAQAAISAPIRVTGLSQVKFLAPLLPGEEAIAVLELQAPSGINAQDAPGRMEPDAQAAGKAATRSLRFRVERSGQAIAQGIFQVALGRKLPL